MLPKIHENGHLEASLEAIPMPSTAGMLVARKSGPLAMVTVGGGRGGGVTAAMIRRGEQHCDGARRRL